MKVAINKESLLRLDGKVRILMGRLNPVVKQSMLEAGTAVVQQLSSAAPQGSGGQSKPIPGDSAGPLSASFSVKVASSILNIETSQPTKLKYVTQGTGVYGPLGQRIYPVNAKALFWQGAAHPFHSVAGQKPNNFVSPLIAMGKQEIIAKVKGDVQAAIKESLGGS